jgi:hypothetical protein
MSTENENIVQSKPSLIYVAGVAPRSGTNYLFDLLSRHPSLGPVLEGEDYFFYKLYYLRLFVSSIFSKWRSEWKIKEQTDPDELLSSLGEGLIQFLRKKALRCDKESSIVLTKTPHPRNLFFFSSLLERGFLVILVRDGRAVTESARRTFDDTFDDAAHRWRRGASQVLSFIDEYGWSSGWHQVVTYEDLVRDTSGKLQLLLDEIGVDFEEYPSESLEETRVIGSSTFGQEEGEVTWNTKRDDGTFNPLDRFSSWSDREHERFDWIAGDELRALGYSSSSVSSPTFTASLKNRVLDTRRLPENLVRWSRSKVKTLLLSYVADEPIS